MNLLILAIKQEFPTLTRNSDRAYEISRAMQRIQRNCKHENAKYRDLIGTGYSEIDCRDCGLFELV